MKMTATEKILAAHAGVNHVKCGDMLLANVDLVMANDITAPVAIREFSALNRPLANAEKVVFVLDHFVPNKDIKSAEQCKTVRDFARENGIKLYDVGCMGIEHALLPEQGYIVPSSLVIGADSHTCTYGALGCFSTGVGSTDAAVALATGKVWLKVPETIRIVLSGSFRKYVSGKDLILSLIGMLGVDGATYKTLEFCGNIGALSMDDRFTVANMAVECGAKNAFFPVDDITRTYLSDKITDSFDCVTSDDGAQYARTVEINLSELEPTVAAPHLPSNVERASDVKNAEIQQVVIGSCTNGRLSDLAAAAEVLKDKKVADGVRCIIIPATQKVYLDALRLGYIETFIQAGAAVSTPTCGPCLGGHTGILASGERCVATTNRNFVGRMGHVGSEVYLASPSVAAASAVAGRVASPEEV